MPAIPRPDAGKDLVELFEKINKKPKLQEIEDAAFDQVDEPTVDTPKVDSPDSPKSPNLGI